MDSGLPSNNSSNRKAVNNGYKELAVTLLVFVTFLVGNILLRNMGLSLLTTDQQIIWGSAVATLIYRFVF